MQNNTEAAENFTLTIDAVTRTDDIAVWRKALDAIKATPSQFDPDHEEQLILWSLDKDNRTFRRVSRLLCGLVALKNDYLPNHIFAVPKEARLWMMSSDNTRTYTEREFQRAREMHDIMLRSLGRKRARGLLKGWGRQKASAG